MKNYIAYPAFRPNATVTPVKYQEGQGGGDFGQEPEIPGGWVDDGESIPCILKAVNAEEQQRAGVTVDPRNRKILFNLDGPVPINTTMTLRVEPPVEMAADTGHYDVKSVVPTAIQGFPKIGRALLVWRSGVLE